MKKLRDFVIDNQIDLVKAEEEVRKSLVDFDSKFASLLCHPANLVGTLDIVDKTLKDLKAINENGVSFVGSVNRIKKLSKEWDAFEDTMGELFDESLSVMSSLPGFVVDFLMYKVLTSYFEFDGFSGAYEEACYFAYECEFGDDGKDCEFGGMTITLDSTEAWEKWLKLTISGKEE